MHWAVEDFMPLWTKEKREQESEVFKHEGILQDAGEEPNTNGRQTLPRQPRNIGTQGELGGGNIHQAIT